MNELALFAGVGGGILGSKLLGWKTICAVENEDYARNVLIARQNDGSLSPFPIWDDVRTFDGKSWKGLVDIISGGFPCQDISVAGNQKGLKGQRSSLWTEFARIIKEVEPKYCFIENSPSLTKLGLNIILSDLAKMGFNARWGIIGAKHITNTHNRERIWILAYSKLYGSSPFAFSGGNDKTIYHCTEKPEETMQSQGSNTSCMLSRKCLQYRNVSKGHKWWAVEPRLGRMANGMAYRVDRLKKIGNGQIPAVVEFTWEILKNLL